MAEKKEASPKKSLTRENIAIKLTGMVKKVKALSVQNKVDKNIAIKLTGMVKKVKALSVRINEDKPMAKKKGETADENIDGGYWNDVIFKRLKMANENELTGICTALKFQYYPSIQLEEISKKYRQAAGHSIMNFTRSSHGLPYKRILIDVADKLKSGLLWTSFKMDDNYSEIDIEEKITQYANIRIEEELKKLTPEERERARKMLEEKLRELGVNQAAINATVTAFTSGSIGIVLSTPAAMSVFYTSGQVLLFALFGSAIVPTVLQLILTGTVIGLAVGAPMLAVTLGGPAYRKIIPVTMRLIAIRKRHEAKLLA